MPDSDVPTSNSPGLVETRLDTVDLPTPAFPKNMFAVIFPSHEFCTIRRLSSMISENKSKLPFDIECIMRLSDFDANQFTTSLILLKLIF